MRIVRSSVGTRAGVVALAALAIALTGCSTGGARVAAPVVANPSPPPSSSPSTSSSLSRSPSSSPSPSSSSPSSSSPSSSPATKASPPPAAKPAPKPTARAPLLVEQLADVGNATQVVIVTARNYETSDAVLRTYEKHADGWHEVYGDMKAHIGKTGFARQGVRQQGDGSTPSGIYKLGFMFGTAANPGVHFEYRHVTSRSIWWVGDYHSAAMAKGIYNTWQDTKSGVTFDTSMSEQLITFPDYAYAQVIEYNMHPALKGNGSAIFLHWSPHGHATAGCVALGKSDLLKVLKWLRPDHHPVIVMAPDKDVRRF